MPARSSRSITARHRLCHAVVVACIAGTPAVLHAQASVPGLPHRPRDVEPPPRHRIVPESARLEIDRRVPLGASPAAQAAVDGGAAYVPLRNGTLAAVDLTTGRVRWTATIAATTAPAAGDGLVFVPDEAGLTAFATNGSLRWRLPLAGGVSAPPLWNAGWLVVPSQGGDVLCLRAADGHVMWTAHVTAPVTARPALTADRVYVSLEDGRVAAYELANGTLAWEHALGGTPGPVLALDDRIFVGAADKFFYCLDAERGKRKWRWRMGGGIVGQPVIDARQVYFVALDNVLRALHRWNGSQRWKQGLPVRPSGSPLLAGSIIYVAGVAAELHAYRAESGAEAGKFEMPAELAAPPQLLPEAVNPLGALVVLTRAGDLLVLHRPIEPAIVPFDYQPGVPVPLTAPPATAPTS